MLDVLEVVEVVRINVKDYLDVRPELEEAVSVLAGFSDEVVAVVHLYVSCYLREIPADKEAKVVDFKRVSLSD